MDDLAGALNLTDKLGVVAVLALLVWAIVKRWLVPGWVLDQTLAELKTCREDQGDRHDPA